MARWRLGVALLLLMLIALPVGWPVVQLLADRDAWQSWRETPRLLVLTLNTLYLVAGTIALTVPLGTFGSILLYRTDLPGRRLFRFVLLLALFVPLPLFASGWQAVLGNDGWLPWSGWNGPRVADPSFATRGWLPAPWDPGIGSAILIHAVAGLPWVVLIVGQGLRRVERELEEDALTVAPPARVVWRVTLPRCRVAVAAAALWVALQTATEITVTDVMQVKTFAEEVYTQLVEDVGVGRAVAVALPWVALTTLLIVATARRWERNLPPRATVAGPPLVFRLGRWRRSAVLLVAGVCGMLLAVPLASLVWRAGLSGLPAAWSPATVWHHLVVVGRAEAWTLFQSLVVAVLAGGSCASLALVVCWTCLDSRRMQTAVLVLMAVAWSLPGPIVGLGLKATFEGLLNVTGSSFLGVVLWYGPSPVPLVWADLIRFFPCAVALLWPVVRQTPPELRDAARMDGATPGQELAQVVWPLHVGAALRAGLAVGVLTLGELSAGKMLSMADWPGYAQTVFVQMHWGIKNDLAARCLWLLAAVTVGTGLVAACGLERSDR